MDETKEKCYFCNSEVLDYFRYTARQITTYKCKHCGVYHICDGITYFNADDKAKAACIACERRLKKQDGYYLNKSGKNSSDWTVIKIDDYMKEFPQDPIERFQRALLNLGRINPSNPFDDIFMSSKTAFPLFAYRDGEYSKIIKLMEQEKFIDIAGTNNGIPYRFFITPTGWKQIAELQEQHKEHSDKAFLAMWFNGVTEKFSEAAKKGAKDAGYILLAVNEKHHNDFIMNKVLNMIDDAKFVIADFTCMPEAIDKDDVKNGVRGGVYYEAGFANGQGKEVIMTCRDDAESQKRIHFDVQQKNTIFWKEKSDGKIVTLKDELDFADYLKERIIRSVGKGPIK